MGEKFLFYDWSNFTLNVKFSKKIPLQHQSLIFLKFRQGRVEDCLALCLYEQYAYREDILIPPSTV